MNSFVGLAFLLAGCDDHFIGQPPDAPVVCNETTDTWETFGAGYVRTWCMSCHSSALAAEYRYAAPIEVNFDTLLDVQTQLEESARPGPGIVEKATGENPSMPPAGGVSAESQERFDNWIACGAPGEGTVVTAECAGPEITGDRIVDSEGAATSLCAEGTSVSGTLTVAASATIECLCSIGGDLHVTDAAVDVSLPAVTSIGGHLRADATGLTSLTLAAPLSGLHSVTGDVLLENLPALTTVLLGELEDVGGDVLVTDDSDLVTLETPRLTSVGGSVRIERNAAIVTLDVPMLEHVGLDFIIAGNPALDTLGDGYDLRDVGGDLILSDNDAWSLMSLASFGKLLTIGGDLVVEKNALVGRVAGFTELVSVTGSVLIRANDDAGMIDGFDNLETIGGDLEVSANPDLTEENAFNLIVTVGGTVSVVDNPQLSVIAGLSYASEVGGLHFEGLTAIQSLQGFGDLTLVNGDLRILECGTQMTDISGFATLTTVTGNLEIAANTGLADLTGFPVLNTVDGNLAVTDNPLLSQLEAQAFADVLTVGGSVTISGNGG